MPDTPSMFDEFSYMGYWQIPGQEEPRWAGTVTYKPEAGIELDLLGAHDCPAAPKVLWGEVPARPYKVMLVNCALVGESSITVGQDVSKNRRYKAQYLLTGCWREAVDGISLKLAGVTFSHLQGWLYPGEFWSTIREGVQVNVTFNNDLRQVHSIMISPNTCLRLTESISISSDLANFRLGKRNHIYIFPISPDTQSLEWFAEHILSTRDLISFLTGMRSEVKEIFGTLSDDDPALSFRGQVNVFHLVRPSEDELHNNDMAFSFEILGQEVTSKVFQTWFALREEYQVPVNLFNSVFYGDHRLGEAQFLTLIQALDCYYQTKYDKVDAYSRESLKGLRDSLPENLRNSLNLQDCYVKKIIGARNQYVHRTPGKENRALEPYDLYNATSLLVHLFVAVFALDLNIPEDTILDAFGRAKHKNLWLPSSFKLPDVSP